MTNNINPKNSYLAIFATLCMVFVSTIIMSDLLTYKIDNFFGLTATLAIVIYPLSYRVSNIITECFGKGIAISVIIIGLILEVLFDCFLTIASLIPNAPALMELTRPDTFEPEKNVTRCPFSCRTIPDPTVL